ncbi:hypothetical protein ACP70R_019781 [Stipagrostis hirtigluma subsp. patula]
MTEFVILLAGCERIIRRPYDTYLYMENFMFGRHVEKQQGGILVGKKTLVAHVCNDERVHAHFSSILHLNTDNFLRVNPDLCASGSTLVIVEFTSDVRDEDWTKFYSLVARMGKGSKVIVITRLENLSRFGTVKPICLKNLWACLVRCHRLPRLSYGK